MDRLTVEPTIHDSVRLDSVELGSFTEVGSQCYLENVSMGDYSYCGELCIMQNAEIGKFSSIAAFVRIGPTRHPMERPTLHHFTYRRVMYGFSDQDDADFFRGRSEQMARIGHDTWIGHGAIIMPGITIGIGAVIGAGAVVTRDVPPYAVAVGVPAKVVKYRFDADTAAALIESGWWEWPHETIRERLQDFTGSTEKFIELYAKRSGEAGR